MSPRKLRVGIVGVGNCASSFVQGLAYYRDASANEPVPGLMNVELGGYHVGDIEIAAAFDVNAAQGRPGRGGGDPRAAQQHPPLRRRPADRRHRSSAARRSTASAATCDDEIRGSTRRRSDVAGVLRETAHRRAGLLPARRLAARDRVLCRARAGGRLRLRQLHPGVHRLEPGLGAALRGRAACRSSATTSRARSAPPSCTACSPTCSASAACGSTAPTSSISAATPISRTCWSASGWSRRRSPRRRR